MAAAAAGRRRGEGPNTAAVAAMLPSGLKVRGVGRLSLLPALSAVLTRSQNAVYGLVGPPGKSFGPN